MAERALGKFDDATSLTGDGADRRADDPVEVDAELIEGLIDTDLIGAERPAALQHQHLLTVGGQVRIFNTLRHERCPELEEGCRLFDRAEFSVGYRLKAGVAAWNMCHAGEEACCTLEGGVVPEADRSHD